MSLCKTSSKAQSLDVRPIEIQSWPIRVAADVSFRTPCSGEFGISDFQPHDLQSLSQQRHIGHWAPLAAPTMVVCSAVAETVRILSEHVNACEPFNRLLGVLGSPRGGTLRKLRVCESAGSVL